MSDLPITKAQFARALDRLKAMKPKERQQEAKRLNASGARSYFALTNRGEISLKLVTRAAYADAGLPWRSGEGPQSSAVFRKFQTDFRLLHRPGKLKTPELDQQLQRERAYTERLARPEQAVFRRELLALDPQCALTACAVVNALEAAHIQPVAKDGDFDIGNGLLLRADLHRLFDFGYLAIHPRKGTVWLHKSCRSDYEEVLRGSFVSEAKLMGAQAAFRERWDSRADKA